MLVHAVRAEFDDEHDPLVRRRTDCARPLGKIIMQTAQHAREEIPHLERSAT